MGLWYLYQSFFKASLLEFYQAQNLVVKFGMLHITVFVQI